MEGIKTREEQGFIPVVFESIIDTLPGGVTLDLTGYTNADKIVPAGTPIGKKDPATGLAKIVTVSGSALSETPIGYLQTTIKADANPFASVVIEGTIRIATLAEDYQLEIELLEEALPKITHV